eukprot:GHVU01093410.1.p1 GENE.GHVU01093410.1~~GHVU01093410.1.p1  ORF type:complete len:469 (-),score=89.59 GHVU01093410.1:277-1683(-)
MSKGKKGGAAAAAPPSSPCKPIDELMGPSSARISDPVRAADVPPEQFYDRHVRARRPVLLDSWRDVDPRIFNLTLESLKAVAGGSPVRVERRDGVAGSYGHANFVTMDFGKFVDAVTSHNFYFTTQKIEMLAGGPAALCSTPLREASQLFDHTLPIFGGLVPFQYNIWIGATPPAAPSTTGLHHDFHDNFYVVLRGKKRFTLYPSETPIPTNGGPCRTMMKNGLITYQGHVREDGAPRQAVIEHAMEAKAKAKEALLRKQLSAKHEADKPRQEEEEQQLNRIDAELDELMDEQMNVLLNPPHSNKGDKNRGAKGATADIPHFCSGPPPAGTPPIVVDIDEGQCLYLPASWYHKVDSLGLEAEGEGSVHLAFNYWLHPPATAGKYGAPYTDDYWATYTAPLLQAMQEQRPPTEKTNSRGKGEATDATGGEGGPLGIGVVGGGRTETPTMRAWRRLMTLRSKRRVRHMIH